jgi:hypothetical protein
MWFVLVRGEVRVASFPIVLSLEVGGVVLLGKEWDI